MSILSGLLNKITGRVSKDTVTILKAIDESDLVKGFGKDAMEALSEYEIVIPETHFTIRRRTPGP
jgi:hypothetical protein